MSILNKKGYTIEKNAWPKKILEKFKKELTVKPVCLMKEFAYAIDSFPVYTESKNKLYLPRYYGIDKIGEPDKIKFKYSSINTEFKGDLRESQLEPYNATLDTLKNTGGGVLCLNCGSGKTVQAIKLICELKVKTLVIVNKEFLMNQWKERLQQFSNATVGTIQQDTMDTDKDVVIGMLHSISKKNYSDYVFKGIGMVIVDEVHHVCTRLFSQALPKIASKYTLGLSATPDRKDGLSKVFYWYIGPVCYTDKSENKLKVKVEQHVLTANSEWYTELKNKQDNANVAGMINNICSFPQRAQYTVDIIKRFYTDPQRCILVLNDRRKWLKDMHTILTEQGISCGLYIGAMKNEDLKESETKRVVLATYALVSEAFDLPKLNTLIMSSPKKEIEQAVGRILRKKHTVTTTIVDIVDRFSCFTRQGYYRTAFYKKKGYTITKYPVEFEGNKFVKKNGKLIFGQSESSESESENEGVCLIQV